MGAPEGAIKMNTLADVKACLTADPTPSPAEFNDACIEMWQDGELVVYKLPNGSAWMEMVAK